MEQMETEKLKKALTLQYFQDASFKWDLYTFKPIAIQFFVRDSWDHFIEVEQKFKDNGDQSTGMGDWELGILATAYVSDMYCQFLWNGREKVTAQEAINFLDISAFDKWAENVSEDKLSG